MFTLSLRRLTALVLALLCILSAASVQADDEAPLYTGVAIADAKIYQTDDAKAKVLGTIPKGNEATITRESGEYYVVLYHTTAGYALKSAIRCDALEENKGPAYVAVALKDDGVHVIALQQALHELGFYTGKVDGKFGAGTRSAVLAFQKANGLTATGAGDVSTQRKLYEGTVKNSKGKSVTVKTAPALLSYALSSGNTGVAVEQLQRRLKELGYYSRTVDGSFGSSTVAAVKAFQKANGLTVTGRADADTQNLLYNERAELIGKWTATPKGKATPTPAPAKEGAVTYPFSTYTLAAVNLRKAASTASARLLTIPKGAEISVSSVSADFVKATYKGKAGYVAAEFVKIPTQYLPGKALTQDSDAQQHYPLLQTGSSGRYVAILQEALKELGFFAGSADGQFGATTAASLKAFQKKNAIRQDGIATPEVQKLILEGRPLNAKGKRTDVKILPLIDDIDLRLGDKGEAVAALQEQLIRMGVYTGKATGTFDAATQKAVKEFQTQHSLYADGVVGAKTRRLILLLSATAVPKGTPTPSPAPQPTATPTPITAKNVVVMRSGVKGAAVKRLQERLVSLGYYTSTPDGVYNADDVAAVKEFQRKNGLKIDGVAGLETQVLLFSDEALPATTASLPAVTAAPTAKTAATATPAPSTQTLRLGSSGTDVKVMQQRLKDLGYYTGKLDGQFGTGTAQAVTAFQKNNSLTADGVAGLKTLNKLYASSAKAASPAPQATAAVPTQNALRAGDRGNEVKAMQRRLVALGYLSAADGIYGIQTYNAVMAFQKRNSLQADGIAGKMTLNRLNSAAAVPAQGTAQAAASQNAATGSTTFKAPAASEVRNANWYSEIRSRAKLMPDVVIYDPDTGLHFNLHMFSFGKHADAEPPTAADTEVLNKICGVNSWTPHYVWVIFSDGRVYIGSIHSHGHEVDHTSGNNLDGHICLHFPRVMSEAEATGPYAVSHQKEILYGWEITQAMAK